MSLNEPTVGQTTGPAWATETNSNWESIDAHDHTGGKGVQLTPSSLNINSDVEFNLNSATELKNVVLDNTVHGSASGDTNVSLYAYDGNLYYRNASGVGVKITSGSAVSTTGGSISGMSTNAEVLFSSNSYAFKFDKTLSDPGMAKMSFADIDLYKYNSSGSAAKVALKFLGSGTSAALTVPDETGTLLSTATNFAGTINIATSSSNAPIILKPNGTGHVTIGNGGATGKLTSNGAYDLILDTNAGTNSGSITITDGANGEITIDTHGTGDINLTAGSDVNIPQDIGLVFGDDGEKIEGDGTNLTINSSALLNLSATTDVVIPVNVGLVLGDGGEKIESDNTDLTITSGVAINLNAAVLDLSAQTVDVTLNAAVDALNFDSNTLSIDASHNRVGIGTAAPSVPLHISAGTASPLTLEITDLGGDITLKSTAATPADGSAIMALRWEAKDDGGNNTVYAIAQGTVESDANGSEKGGLNFILANAAGSTAEVMTIMGDGKVGINVVNPQAPLDLSTADNTVAVRITQAGNETYGIGVFSGSGSTDYMSFGMTDMVGTASSRFLNIQENGYVGIGTTSVDALLHIESTDTPVFQIETTGTVDRKWHLQVVEADGRFLIRDDTASRNPFNIDTNGNVGFNTATPNYLSASGTTVSIAGSSQTGVLELVNTSTGGTASLGSIEFLNLAGGSSVTSRALITASRDGADDATNMRFFTQPTGGSVTERMRIASTGNVGINVTPGANIKLYTVGASSASSSYCAFFESASASLMYLRNDGYVWAYQAWATSDKKKKKNINYINEDILPQIEKLKLAKFDYTDVEIKNNYGFIAQDVEKVFPDCISDTVIDAVLYQDGDEIPDGKKIGDIRKEKSEQKNLNYNFLFSHLVKAVQELSAKVTVLEGA